MKKPVFFVFFLLTVLVSHVFGVPANPSPISHTQSDGTVVTVYIRGDEKVSWMESLDGYTLLYAANRDLVYAVRDASGDLQPSQILYKGDDLTRYSASNRKTIEALLKRMRYSSRQRDLFKQIWAISDEVETAEASSQNAASLKITPVFGEKKVLCILANFSDRTFVKSLGEFENLMNQVGYTANGNSGSVKDFYRANSYGKMDLTVTVAGPVTLSGKTTDYAENGSKYYDFPKEVAQLANASVNFADFAVNGAVPNFHIIFAGYGAESAGKYSTIWSHKYSFVRQVGNNLYYDFKTYDGVQVGISYSCSPELRGASGATLTAIGVACHELCHAFGAPDYYDTDYAESGGQYSGTGSWDLMANGSWNGSYANGSGTTPAQINMLQKILFGWVTPLELSAATTVSDMPNSSDSAMAYIIKANNDLYVLENRQKRGYDSYVPGKGLLIYHAHSGALSGKNSNATHPQQCYVVSACSTTKIPGSAPTSYGSITDARTTFPGTSNKTSFTGETTPAMFYWSGSSGVAVTDKPLTDISENTEKQTVSFLFMGGDPMYPPEITTHSLLSGNVSVAYLDTLKSKSAQPVSWSLQSGSLPAGLTLSVSGIISGVPTTPGVSNFTVQASNVGGSAVQSLTITINDVQQLPYFEGFETAPETALPDQWTTINTGWRTMTEGTALPGFMDAQIEPYSGTRVLFTGWQDADETKNPWAFSGGILLNAETSYKISFWYAAPGYEEEDEDINEFDDFSVQIGKKNTIAGMADAEMIFKHQNLKTNQYTKVEKMFVPSETGVYFLGFRHFSETVSGAFVYIDDLSITEVVKSSGSAVTTPTVAAKSYDSICVNPVSLQTSTGQAVEYSIHQQSDAEEGELQWQADVVFKNLTANTVYYVYARSAENANYMAGETSVSSAVETLKAPVPPTILTSQLPGDTVGNAYYETLVATGDSTIVWALQSGSLPPGLVLSQNGIINGIPTAAGVFYFTVSATNQVGNHTKNLSIAIYNPSPSKTLDPAANNPDSPLTAWISDNILNIKGLEIWKTYQIYSVSGTLVYQNTATSDVETLPAASLQNHGVYIIRSEEKWTKFVW